MLLPTIAVAGGAWKAESILAIAAKIRAPVILTDVIMITPITSVPEAFVVLDGQPTHMMDVTRFPINELDLVIFIEVQKMWLILAK